MMRSKCCLSLSIKSTAMRPFSAMTTSAPALRRWVEIRRWLSRPSSASRMRPPRRTTRGAWAAVGSSNSARGAEDALAELRDHRHPVQVPRRHGHGERAAGAGARGHDDVAAQQPREALADDEAQARAAEAARHRFVGLREGLEEPADLLLGHADAGVAHLDLDEVRLRGGRGAAVGPFHGRRHAGGAAHDEVDLPLLRELDRVRGKVHEDLPQPQRVALDLLGDAADGAHAKVQALLAGPRPHERRDLDDQARQVAADALDRHATRLDL